MKKKLRSYQHCGVEYFYALFFQFKNKYNYGILADEGGLGKTITSLALLEILNIRQGFKIFCVLCPAGLREMWIETINAELPPKEERNYFILIETYSGILDIKKANNLYRRNIDFMIIDEGHYLKNFDSIRTERIYGSPEIGKKIIRKVKYILNVSATICPSNVSEIYPYLWAVNSEMIHNLSMSDFLTRYAKSFAFTEYGLKVEGIKNEDNFLRNKPFFLRRTIDQVAHDIPKGQRINIDLEMSAKLYREEKELIKELLKESGLGKMTIDDLLNDPEYFELTFSSLPGFTKYSEFRKRLGLLKVKPIIEYLKEIVIPEHQKFILFTFHTGTALKYYELLEKICKKLKIELVLITGLTDKTERHNIIKAANKKEKIIVISTIGAIREGYNAQGFRFTFFGELDWRWYALLQCEYRTRRIGSKEKMFWYYFIFDKGIDQKIFKAMQIKKETTEKIYNKI